MHLPRGIVRIAIVLSAHVLHNAAIRNKRPQQQTTQLRQVPVAGDDAACIIQALRNSLLSSDEITRAREKFADQKREIRRALK